MFTLVIGDEHKPEIRKLVSVLHRYFPSVVTLNSAGGEVFRRFSELDLMILTDTAQCETGTPIELRKHFPDVNFPAVFDRVEPEMELALRCVRTLFLGSYERFHTFSQAILAPLLAGRPRPMWNMNWDLHFLYGRRASVCRHLCPLPVQSCPGGSGGGMDGHGNHPPSFSCTC